MAHTIDELKQLQAMPLNIKIRMTQNRIREWIREFGKDGVYVSFSGGKDSTVLLDIVRCEYPEVKAVFFDTGLEYPEIREFVKTYENVDWVKPKMTFKETIMTYGYPFTSKEISEVVYYARRDLKQGLRRKWYDKLTTDTSRYNARRHRYMLDAPFEIGNRCCAVFKKRPSHEYEKKTGRKKMTATLACESQLRTQKWLKNGCNAFEIEHPCSNPMSFWTEQDVLRYIYEKKLPIASIYGEVVPEQDQISMFDDAPTRFKTTGVNRTGCIFCGFGCHMPGDERFVKLKQSHPNIYEYIMKPVSEGGLGYKEIIDWINENGHYNIKY